MKNNAQKRTYSITRIILWLLFFLSLLDLVEDNFTFMFQNDGRLVLGDENKKLIFPLELER